MIKEMTAIEGCILNDEIIMLYGYYSLLLLTICQSYGTKWEKMLLTNIAIKKSKQVNDIKLNIYNLPKISL